ncbi:nuclear pore complex component-domain-containing protein [Amylocarpus encephaloides]|uniref:Nuclear pore complex component-domain-containing protein n=1 Tax=Amylocarpus encephaloides TaxID=45428 RepID=A0A9P7YJ09_9HELO|nr:nuclear pore complex component-domain-containing protein [Amylocarpus encephaloides]
MSQAMTTPVRPLTPTNAPKEQTPVTGTWKHPRLDEIIRRQDASTFSQRNLKIILYNVVAISVNWYVGGWLWAKLPGLFDVGKILSPYATWAYYLLHATFLYNIALALSPLVRGEDPVEDIPLTPAQRATIGLPPSSRAPTPDAKYSTPPKYQRTPTMGNSAGSKGSYQNSPLSGKGKESPLGDSISGSRFSPNASPLIQKVKGDGLGGTRRHSYGSGSPLGPGNSRFSIPEMPGSPSPSGVKTPSVGLNSKWLYDKERRNSGSARLYT